MTKKIGLYVVLSVFLFACTTEEAADQMPTEELWTNRLAILSGNDSLMEGSTYLSIYSHITSISEHRIHDLTVTVSLRNTSRTERVFIKRADYYNTKGTLVRAYLDSPIYIEPMETTEIMIFEKDEKGGSGGNFIFDWATNEGSHIPYFEAVMISTVGQQGLSFTTKGEIL